MTVSASTDAATPHLMPSTPLEGEQRGQATTGDTGADDDQVKATQDQDQESATSASAQSASHDHPGTDATTTDPARPSEDLADTMGDDEHRPDAPTEPPNKPLDEEVEGTRVEGSEVKTAMAEVLRGVQESPDEDGSDEDRPGMADEPPDEAQVKPRDCADVEVEAGGETVAGRNRDVTHECADAGTDDRAEEAHGAVQVEGENAKRRRDESIAGERWSARQSKASRGIEESLGVDGDEERRPGWPDEPPDKPYGAPHDPKDVQVEPGGETVARRSGSAAHKDADVRVDGRAEEAHGAVQFEAERSATCPNMSIEGERGSALAQGQSTTTVEENNQRTSPDMEDVPEDPPEPPPPLILHIGLLISISFFIVIATFV